MSNPSVTYPERAFPHPNPVRALPEIDDDDEDAERNLDDDEDVPRHPRWISGAGFGSPEWWSH